MIENTTDIVRVIYSERITADELAYHQYVLKNDNKANDMLIEAKNIIRIAKDKKAATVSWAQHLQEKYNLAVGDSVELDGTITRSKG